MRTMRLLVSLFRGVYESRPLCLLESVITVSRCAAVIISDARLTARTVERRTNYLHASAREKRRQLE